MPTYRSTDFDVHRNWLAITKNLPLSQWYFDNVNGTTVHTLDYPPAFAFFEWILSNNPITVAVLQNDRCLDLLPDYDNTPSINCIVFQRTTVILSDVILWLGAWMSCQALHRGRSIHHSTLCFLLIVLNPGLLWLDHIHFQYNGMLLGILLASLGCLMDGIHLPPDCWAFDLYHLAGAALYALLLNMKHLYLPLAPVYFCYLLGKYCWVESKFAPKKFMALAVVTTTTLVLPWVPFLLQENPKDQILQILSRLFPFGRGLVHDYWAANVWAFYAFANKVVRFLATRIPLPIQRLPEPTPLVCAICLFLSILPGLVVISRRRTKVKLLQTIVYTSMCSFMLAYHVHEKAILTALIPLTVLVEHSGDHDHARTHNYLFWQSSLWGLLGLFPLLFRPMELVFKVVSYFTYLEWASFLMTTPPLWLVQRQKLSAVIVGVVIGILEFWPKHNKWEFLPLMFTSLVCAHGLIGCWALSLYVLIQKTNIPRMSNSSLSPTIDPVPAGNATHAKSS